MTNDSPASVRSRLQSVFEHFESSSTFVRTLIINLVFVIAFVAVVPLVAVEMFRERVTIEPIAVPEEFANLGFTSDVVANRLWDAVQQVSDEARTAKERLSVLPSSRRVEFAFPDSGLSFESLIYHVRSFFNLYETRISGEFVCAQSPCGREALRLRIRLLRSGMDIVELPPIGDLTDDGYFKRAAAEVLRHLDPFVAASYLHASDPAHALADLRKIVRAKHPDAKWALNLIGNIMSDQGRHAEAKASYEAALKLDPDYRIAMVNLARLTSEMGKHDEAVVIIARAIELGPNDAQAWEVRGMIEWERGRTEEAIDHYRGAAERDPNSTRIAWRIGYALSRLGKIAEARQAFLQAIEIDPEFVDARTGLALVAMMQQDYRELLAQYREIARLKPNDSSAIADVASALVLNKEIDQAIAAYREASQLEPKTASYLNHLGQLLRDKGQLAEAETALREAIAIEPALAEAWFNLGVTYQRLERKPEAKQAFEKFIELDASSPFVALAKAYLDKLGET